MKTKERQRSVEPGWYTSAAQPTTPEELTRAERADLVQEASDEEDVVRKRRKMGWVVAGVLFSATIAVAAGNVFDSIYWATLAFFYVIEGKPRGRVPKYFRYLVAAAVLVLTAVQLARLLTKIWR